MSDQDASTHMCEITEKMSEKVEQEKHFTKIYELARSKFNECNISNLKTSSGNTQNCERYCISIIRSTLEELGYEYNEAGSQQPYDFRVKIQKENNVIDTLLLEIKKTDSNCVYFNDTCPSEKAFYIVLFTGKEYKKKENILPCLFGINGSEFVKQDPWIVDYAEELNSLKQKYKSMGVRMSVYPRPTYKANIKFLFEKYYDVSKLELIPKISSMTTTQVVDAIPVIEATPLEEKVTEVKTKPVFKIKRKRKKKFVLKSSV